MQPQLQPTQEYTQEERQLLLRIAHRSIESAVRKQEFRAEPVAAHLQEPRGAFTTIHLRGQLHGCVGYILPALPLHATVAETAACGDERPPVCSAHHRGSAGYQAGDQCSIEAVCDLSGAGAARSARFDRERRKAARTFIAASRPGAWLGCGAIPLAHLPEGAPSSGRLAAGRKGRGIHRGDLWGLTPGE